MSTTQALQIISISTALLTSGGIATLTLFDTPLLLSQPASRSLPMTRWLFSRGSHIFPTCALLSSSTFLSLAYSSLPAGTHSLSTLFQHAIRGQPGLYLAAAALTISIAPWTAVVMVPTNFELIRRNEELGGTRSAESAEYRYRPGKEKRTRTAEESVDGKDDIGQWGDWSGPQEKTQRESTKKEDEQVRELLRKFGWMNGARAVLMGLGGIVGLAGALA